MSLGSWAAAGVRGRNSDNTLIREKIGWEPSINIEFGLKEVGPFVPSLWLGLGRTPLTLCVVCVGV